MNYRILFWLCLASLCAAQCTNMDKPAAPTFKQIVAIRNGQLFFADGSSQPIPHYGDPTYTTFYCVRHAEKMKDGTKDPDLSPEGQARAQKLGKIMDEARLDKVCTTNTKRTIQTGEAVRYWAGDPAVETFTAPMQDSWLSDKLGEDKGKNIFYVGHQNTVPQLLNRLLGKVQYYNLAEDSFDHFYLAISQGIGQTEVLEFRY